MLFKIVYLYLSLIFKMQNQHLLMIEQMKHGARALCALQLACVIVKSNTRKHGHKSLTFIIRLKNQKKSNLLVLFHIHLTFDFKKTHILKTN